MNQSIMHGRVAVIGSGLAGISAALRLADAGVQVVIFERNDTLFSGASAVCEGKIHLGYTYALDSSHATTQMLLAGAASFRRILTRWLPQDGLGLSERPFLYASPRDSMVTEDGIATHLSQVQKQAAGWGENLLCHPGKGVRRLSATELDTHFDSSLVSAAWETNELASNPTIKRPFLLSALNAQRFVEARTHAEVTGITSDDAGWVVKWGVEGMRERFSAVINASWEQRLRLDECVGLRQPRSAVHRFKCGLHLHNKNLADRTPNVTFIIGEYGDTVACGEMVYVSWYLAGLLKDEIATAPDTAPVRILESTAVRIRDESISAISRYLPGYGQALVHYANSFQVRGGYISAWGKSGITDPQSGLHSRSEIGVTSLKGFHSINTGKYSTAPLFGEEAALRVLAEMGVEG